MNDHISIRTYRPENLETLVALMNEADAYDHTERATTLEEMEREMRSPNYYPDTDCFLAWDTATGRLAGYADIFMRQGEQESWAFTWGIVHPDWRRRGLGLRLMQALYDRVRERASEVEHGPIYLSAGGHDFEAGRLALFEALGMQRIRYYVNMARPLNGSLPPVLKPAGFCLRPFELDRDVEPIWRVINTAFHDHWGHIADVALDEFVHNRIDVPHFRPEVSLVAEDEATGEIVGCSLNKIDPDWIAHTGRKEGYIGTLAVLREERHHGLGTALLAQSLHVMRAEGMEGIHLHADAENLTGAVRIYERLGFQVRKTFVSYRSTLRET